MKVTKQTATQWLFNNLKSHFEHDGDLLEVVQMSFEQAKEMEKEQMCDFFREGYMWCNSPSLRIENGEIVTSTIKYGEFYYNKTFKNTEQ